jgi:hypothetical protein
MVDVADVHMGEALEVPGGRLSLIPVGGRRRHMEARPQSAGLQAGLGARRRMAAYMKEHEWRAQRRGPSGEE